jgi:hypothetical protein
LINPAAPSRMLRVSRLMWFVDVCGHV